MLDIKTFQKVASSERTLAVLLATLGTVIFFGPVFLGANYVDFWGVPGLGADSTGAWLVTSNLRTVRRLMELGREIPLWDFSESAGKPILGDPSYRLFNPFTWLGLISPEAHWLNVLLMIKLTLTGLFTWRLARSLNFSRVAACLSMLLWQGNMQVFAYCDHNFSDVFFFFPLALLGVREVFAGKWRRGCIELGAAVYMFATGGNPQTALIGYALTGLMGLALLASGRESPLRGRVTASLFCCLGVLLGVLWALPEILAMVDYHNYWDSAHVSHHGGAPGPLPALETLVRIFCPQCLDSGLGFSAEGYMGFSFLGAGLVLVALPWLRGAVFVPFALCAFGHLYLLFEGLVFPTMPVRTLLGATPLAEFNLYKYREGIHFSLAMLAGFSLDTLRAKARQPRRRLIASGLGVLWTIVVCLALCVVAWRLVRWGFPGPVATATPLLTETLWLKVYLPQALAIGSFALFWVSMKMQRFSRMHQVVGVLWLGLVAAELVRAHQYRDHPVTQHEANRAIRANLHEGDAVFLQQAQEHQAPFRVATLGFALVPGLANSYGIQMVQGANAIQIRNYSDFYWHTLSPVSNAHLIVPGFLWRVSEPLILFPAHGYATSMSAT